MQRHRKPPIGPPFRPASRRPWATGAVVVFTLVAVAATLSRGDESVVPPSATTAPSDVSNVAAAARLAPLVRAAAVESHALVALGESRSRNLFAIRSAQDRMAQRLDAVDGALAAATPPRHLDDAVAAYRAGAGTVRRAMDEAEAGFLRLDWDRVARATELLNRGSSLLDRAALLLGGAMATPTAEPPP